MRIETTSGGGFADAHRNQCASCANAQIRIECVSNAHYSYSVNSYIQAYVSESGSSAAEKMAYQCTERESAAQMIPNTKHFEMRTKGKWFKVNIGIWRHLVFLWVSERLQASHLHTSTRRGVCSFGYEYLRAKHVILRA